MTPLEQIASFASTVDFSQLPAAAQEQTIWILADTVGAIAGGSAEPEARTLAAKQTQGGRSYLVGHGRFSDAASAAFMNGVSGTFLELDEGNRFSRGHPAVHVIPAVLACAGSRADPNSVLSAIVAGYEVASRIGSAGRLRSSMHPHGTWGTIGAAVAIGRLDGVSPQEMRNLINIASSLTIATSKQTMLEGALVRNVYSGLANRHGLLALDLLKSGFTGEDDGLGSLFGQVVSESFDPAQTVEALGRRWCLQQNYFKLHACCRYNHAALDVLDALAQDDRLPPAAEIAAVHVETYDIAAELDDQEPANTLAAKFSIPFAVAARLHRGGSGWRSFTWKEVKDETIRALSARVHVTEDPSMTARLPHERPARVTITLANQRQITHEVSVNRGDETSPYSRDQLATKFQDLTGRIWPAAHCDELLGAIMTLAREPNSFSRMADLLGRPPEK